MLRRHSLYPTELRALGFHSCEVTIVLGEKVGVKKGVVDDLSPATSLFGYEPKLDLAPAFGRRR